MSLLLRINAALGAVFLIAASLAGYICWTMLEDNAQREVLAEAGLMMDSAAAVRSYTAKEILPLISARNEGRISAAKRAFLRRDAKLSAFSRTPSGLCVQGGDAQSDQSARSRRGVGGRHHSAVSQRCAYRASGRRARHADGQIAVPGEADSRQAGVSRLPQHSVRGPAEHDRALRQRQRLRLAAQ